MKFFLLLTIMAYSPIGVTLDTREIAFDTLASCQAARDKIAQTTLRLGDRAHNEIVAVMQGKNPEQARVNGRESFGGAPVVTATADGTCLSR
jgi:hypothetical protein